VEEDDGAIVVNLDCFDYSMEEALWEDNEYETFV